MESRDGYWTLHVYDGVTKGAEKDRADLSLISDHDHGRSSYETAHTFEYERLDIRGREMKASSSHQSLH